MSTPAQRSFSKLQLNCKHLLTAALTNYNLFPDQINHYVYDSLLNLPLAMQIEIVNVFCRHDLSGVSDKTSYFLGLIKAFQLQLETMQRKYYASISANYFLINRSFPSRSFPSRKTSNSVTLPISVSYLCAPTAIKIRDFYLERIVKVYELDDDVLRSCAKLPASLQLKVLTLFEIAVRERLLHNKSAFLQSLISQQLRKN